MFVPATLAEYLGLPLDYGERVDLGGATSAGMIWRAAAAVELGLCEAVLCVVPGSLVMPRPSHPQPSGKPAWWGASSGVFGSPQAEFEIPYGNVGQNAPYAQIARRYAAEFGYDPRATAKIAADQRTNACAHPGAVFHGKPLTVDDVLASPMIADPLHMLEIVMRVQGGVGVLVGSKDVARRSRAPPGVDHRVRRAHRVQDSHLRRRHGADPDRRRGRSRVRHGRHRARPGRRGIGVRLLHDHRADVAWRTPGSARRGRGWPSSASTT